MTYSIDASLPLLEVRGMVCGRDQSPSVSGLSSEDLQSWREVSLGTWQGLQKGCQPMNSQCNFIKDLSVEEVLTRQWCSRMLEVAHVCEKHKSSQWASSPDRRSFPFIIRVLC